MLFIAHVLEFIIASLLYFIRVVDSVGGSCDHA